MCGIVGVIGKLSNGFTGPESDMFRDMLFVDTLRGWDSTGVFGVNRHNNVLIHKEASHGPDFICTKEFKSFQTKLVFDGMFAVGHNRAATRGSVSDANAHPFWVDDKIILVQNGTFRGNHHHLKNTDIDSEALAHVLSEEPDIIKALQRINAAYALMWYNTDTQTLYAIRNNERPLYIANSADGTIMFASEYATIAWAAHKNNIAFNEKPELIPVNTLYSYKILPNGKYEHKSEAIDCDYKPVVTVYESSPFRTHGYHQEGAWPDGEYGQQYGGCVSNVGREVVVPITNRKEDMNITMSAYVMDNLPEFHMNVNDVKEFENRLKKKIYGSNDRNINIEMLDYVPGNKNENCTAFIVYGKMVDPMLDTGPQPLFHWLIYGKTEMEIFDIVTKEPFYTGEITSVIPHYFLQNNNERKGIITCFITNPIAHENVEVTQVH